MGETASESEPVDRTMYPVEEILGEDSMQRWVMESLRPPWFRAVGFGNKTRIRVATGPRGDDLFFTPEDEVQWEKCQKEAALADKEAALARVRQLEQELAKKS